MPIKILMPALSPTMTEGNLVQWHKKPGDPVNIGDILAEIETDKATMEVEAIDDGIMGQIYVAAGTEAVQVNTLIAALLEDGEDKSVLDGLEESAPQQSSREGDTAPPASPQPAAPAAEPAKASSPAAPQMAAQSHTSQSVIATPVAKRIAQQQNIDLSALTGSGPHGRIIKADVEAAMASGHQNFSTSDTALLPQGPLRAADDLYPAYEEVKLSTMRKVIAKRLCESKQTVPHFYLTIECNLDTLLAARTKINAPLEKDQRISVNDFVIKALACAMKVVPDANTSWNGDHIKKYHSVDVSVAVAIEGGLVTPVIRAAEHKTLSQIAAEMKALATKARSGKLRPEEFQGGTVSISNLGMFGIKEFGAVINPPQACILAVGAGEKRVIVDDKGAFQAATMMSCTLSVDHRAVDGAIGAAFLKAFKSFIEEPVQMLV